MSDAETTQDSSTDGLWLVNTIGGLFLGLTAFVFLVSWDFVIGASVFALACGIGLVFVPQVRGMIKPPGGRVTGSFLAVLSVICAMAGWLMGPTIAANTAVFGAGALMAVFGLVIGLLGAAAWRDRFALAVAFANTAALALAVWLFMTDRIPAGYGP